MKKEEICSECNQIIKTYNVCDICGERLTDYSICELGKRIFDKKGNPIELTINGIDYSFCSIKHLFKFILNELKKERSNA